MQTEKTESLIHSIQEFTETRKQFLAELHALRERIDGMIQKFDEPAPRKSACRICGTDDHTARFHKKAETNGRE